MREWSQSHPKARLMKRKRAAILAAAQRQFLAHGFGATTMEQIAADAGVSIMTLYRHAESKDDLFAAVMTIACDPGEEGADMDPNAMPLAELLHALATMFEEKMASPERVATLRTVIAESERFPHLADIAYRGAVGHLLDIVGTTLRTHPEAGGLPETAITSLAHRFVDRLLGMSALRLLLGVSGDDPAAAKERVDAAVAELMGTLRASQPAAV